MTSPDALQADSRTMPLLDGRALALAAICACLVALWQFPSPHDGNGDTAWLLIVAGRMLDGARLYVDVIETNPPMSILLYVPGVWLSRQIGGAPELWMYAQVSAMAAVSIRAIAGLSRHAGFEASRDRVMFGLLVGFVLLIMPTRCFGQREHVALIALLPYAVLTAARWHGAFRPPLWLALAVGAGAGLGLAIKPHFALILGLVHLAMLVRAVAWRAGWRDRLAGDLKAGRLIPPEALVAGVLLLVYVASVFRFHPAFFADIYPRLALAYLPHRLTVAEFLAAPATLLLALASAFTLFARFGRISVLGLALLAASLGGFAAYAIQFKGWPYHQIPAFGFMAMAFGALALANAGSARGENRLRQRLACLGMMALFGGWVPGLLAAHEMPRALEAEIRARTTRPTLLIASSNLGINFPLVRRVGGTWAGRSASLWMSEGASALLAVETRPDRRARLAELFDLDRTLFVEDALRSRPDIIALSAFDAPTDLLPWAKADPRMADLLAGYRQTAHVDGLRVLVREDLLAGADRSGPAAKLAGR